MQGKCDAKRKPKFARLSSQQQGGELYSLMATKTKDFL